MFVSRNKKNNVYPCKPQFYYIKVGFKGVCFRDGVATLSQKRNSLTLHWLFPDQIEFLILISTDQSNENLIDFSLSCSRYKINSILAVFNWKKNV